MHSTKNGIKRMKSYGKIVVLGISKIYLFKLQGLFINYITQLGEGPGVSGRNMIGHIAKVIEVLRRDGVEYQIGFT